MSTKLSNSLPITRLKKFNKAMEMASSHNDVEKAVENAVTSLLYDFAAKRYGADNASLSYPYSTDGLISFVDGDNTYSVLVETKKNVDMAGSNYGLLRIVAQVIYYLKRFALEGEHIPDAVVIADKNEITSFPADLVYKYLEGDYDWSIAPSAAGRQSVQLITDMAKDNLAKKIYVHNLEDGESFNTAEFLEDVDSKTRLDKPIKITATKDNLLKVFTNFSTDVFTSTPGLFNKSILGDRGRVEVFLRSLKDDDDIYIHPKKNLLIVDDVEVPNVDVRAYESFWQQHKQGRDGYSHKELALLDTVTDTLIDESQRRMKGDFYTPPIWVDKAHDLIEEKLGANWKEEYVTWDMAAGLRNLTRRYRFGDDKLYTSTLFQEDINYCKSYNPEGCHFQYDFLNDDIDLHSMDLKEIKSFDDDKLAEKFKLPVQLIKDMLDKKPVVFLANPPYGQATDHDGAKKKDISDTEIKSIMKKEKLEHASSELYTQFIYHVQLLAQLFDYTEDDDFNFFFFFNKGFLTSPSYGKFVTGLTSQFHYESGFMLNAGEFNTAADSWGIIFSHWMTKGEKNQRKFTFDVMQSTEEDTIEKITTWTGKKPGKEETISDWLVEIPLGKELSDKQILTKNSVDAPTAKSIRCKLRKGWIGYMHNSGNNVQFSEKYIGMYSMGFANANGRDITEENFTRAAVTFSIRRSVQEDIQKQKLLWVRDKDIFTTPSENLLTDEFVTDCVVYSLFDSQSNQTSLRDYHYNGKTHTVLNPFFPFSVNQIERLAEKHHNDTIQSDIIGRKDSFVYNWLQCNKDHISLEAQALLDEVKEIYQESFYLRNDYAKLQPRYQVNTWDAGWKQIRTMVFGRDRINDDLLHRKPAFDKKLNALADKIAKAAYSDGVI